eukprot:206350_1
MAFSGNSLANLSKQINADPTIKEAVDAQKEYESLLESRRRSKPIVPTADEIRHSSEPSTTKPKRKKRRGLSKQETIAPKSTRTSHVRHASVDTVSRALATDPKNTARNQPQSQLFRTTCQYKKPSTLLRAPDFKSRFIVIDNHFKFMRIYRNEQELKNREPFKYELPLQHCTISIKNVQNRRECVILIIRKQEHTFNFDTDEIRQDAMQHIECCRTQLSHTHTKPSSLHNVFPRFEKRQNIKMRRNTATTVTSMVNEYERQRSLTDTGNTTQTDMNADMLLELYAETDKGRDVARWLNQNKTFVTVQQLQKLGDILRDKQRDHTFIQDFAAGQGLTYLCSISILRQYEWDILVMILDIFQIILNTRDADHGLIGYHGLIEHSHAIQAIVDMFESKNKTVKCKVIRLCTIMCMSDDAGFEAVLKGMYTYGERHNASSVFDEFVRSMYFEQDLEFRRDALKFVNAVLNLSPDLKRRIDSRHMLRELGFNNILDQLWDVIASEQDEDSDHTQDDTDEETPSTSDLLTTARSNAHEGKKNKRKLRYDASVTVQHPLLAEIREQLLLYRQTKEEDDKKVLWEDVNLNDPEQIVRHLFKKAMQQKHISEFMQTLISLCTIPDHASALWGALPELILNATGQKLKSMKLQLDGGEVRFEKKPYLEMEEDQEPAGGSESESDPTMIFNDMDLLKEKLDEAMQEVIQQEQQEINQQIKKLNKKAEKLARENMKLENQKINFMSKSAGQQFKIDEMTKDMDKIKEELKETHARLDEARIQLESRPSPSLKSRSPLFAAEAAPILIPVKIAPVPTPAPLPGAPMPAPLPGSAPIPAPLPNAAPKPAPVPGILQKPAPIPGSAPLPASAPIPAPLPGAPIPAPLPGAAPIPATAPMAAPIPATDAKINPSDVPPAPPIKLGVPKRYDEQQEAKLKKLKDYIEYQTKISAVNIIEGYIREFTQTATISLFQIAPQSVIHLCYKYCTQFKNYFILMYARYSNYHATHINILGINDIFTYKHTNKRIQHWTEYNAASNYHHRSVNTLLYVPHLDLSQEVLNRIPLYSSSEHIPFAGVFRVHPQAKQTFEMMCFPSPYFYDYTLNSQNQGEMRYYRYTFPQITFPLSDVYSMCHIPFSNQLLWFGSYRNKTVVSVLDLHNARWLTKECNSKYIELHHASITQQSLCLVNDKLFIIGGVNMATEVKPVRTVQMLDTLDVWKLYEVDSTKKVKNQCKLEAVEMTSELKVARANASCDVLSVKNNQIVCGGGVCKSWFQYGRVDKVPDAASNTMEFYDHVKDEWYLQSAKTIYPHKKARLWCNGNLIFIAGPLVQGSTNMGDVGYVECIDVRDSANKWQKLDEKRDIQKLFNLFNVKNNHAFTFQGLFV